MPKALLAVKKDLWLGFSEDIVLRLVEELLVASKQPTARCVHDEYGADRGGLRRFRRCHPLGSSLFETGGKRVEGYTLRLTARTAFERYLPQLSSEEPPGSRWSAQGGL